MPLDAIRGNLCGFCACHSTQSERFSGHAAAASIALRLPLHPCPNLPCWCLPHLQAKQLSNNANGHARRCHARRCHAHRCHYPPLPAAATARRCHRPPLPPPHRAPCCCHAHRCHARRDRTSNPIPKGGGGGSHRPLNRVASTTINHATARTKPPNPPVTMHRSLRGVVLTKGGLVCRFGIWPTPRRESGVRCVGSH